MTGSLAARATVSLALDLKPVDITPWRRGHTGIDYVATFDNGMSVGRFID